MPKFAKRRDSNDKEVFESIPNRMGELPIKMLDVSTNPGMLDRVIFLGDLALWFELKVPSLVGKPASKVLTPREQKFPGPFFIVHNSQEVMMVLEDQYGFALYYTKERHGNRIKRQKSKVIKESII